jgi:hypothetical protein
MADVLSVSAETITFFHLHVIATGSGTASGTASGGRSPLEKWIISLFSYPSRAPPDPNN